LQCPGWVTEGPDGHAQYADPSDGFVRVGRRPAQNDAWEAGCPAQKPGPAHFLGFDKQSEEPTGWSDKQQIARMPAFAVRNMSGNSLQGTGMGQDLPRYNRKIWGAALAGAVVHRDYSMGGRRIGFAACEASCQTAYWAACPLPLPQST